MNSVKCRKARKLMHELVDGTLPDRAELDEHLVECAECRTELRALAHVESAVRDVVECDVSEQALQRLTAGVVSALPAHQPVAPRAFGLRWMPAAAVIALAMFSAGLGVGRWLWPRETTVTRVVMVPEVREKVVEVEVPVVRERVVIKEVPVVKTRVVYRDREAPPAITLWGAPSEPVKLDPIVIRLSTAPALPTPTLQQEVRPAMLAGDSDEDEPSPTQSGGEASDTTTMDAGVAQMASAGRSPSA